jgi:4-methyl-5(b-hydroxyethyl)-thiazole monophosphate biosynthesis
MASVLVPLAPGCEELEAVTVIDLLRRASIEVVVAGLEPGPVTGARGTVLLPDTTLEEALVRDFDMIALPGGEPGATHLARDARLIGLIKKMSAGNKHTAAICAAPKALAEANVLDGKRATCYPGALDPAKYPRIRLEASAVVTDGKVTTARGPGASMDFALELIELLVGKDKRREVEARLLRPGAR